VRQARNRSCDADGLGKDNNLFLFTTRLAHRRSSTTPSPSPSSSHPKPSSNVRRPSPWDRSLTIEDLHDQTFFPRKRAANHHLRWQQFPAGLSGSDSRRRATHHLHLTSPRSLQTHAQPFSNKVARPHFYPAAYSPDRDQSGRRRFTASSIMWFRCDDRKRTARPTDCIGSAQSHNHPGSNFGAD